MNAAIEVVILPTSDPAKSLQFYSEGLGFHLDVDYAPSPEFRVVQLTPPGSATSIQFGVGLTDAQPGSVQGVYLVVADVDAARQELIDRGVAVSSIRHKDAEGGWRGRYLPGLDPERGDYASFADVRDPDGNGWVLQECGYRQ